MTAEEKKCSGASLISEGRTSEPVALFPEGEGLDLPSEMTNPIQRACVPEDASTDAARPLLGSRSTYTPAETPATDAGDGRQILWFANMAARRSKTEAKEAGIPFDDLVSAAAEGELRARIALRTSGGSIRWRGYRWQAARNGIADAFRRERKHHDQRDPDFERWYDDDSPEVVSEPSVQGLSTGMPRNTATEHLVETLMIRSLVARLSHDDQIILRLRIQGFQVAEIARSLRSRKATICKRLDTIKRMLRETLGPPAKRNCRKNDR